LYVYVCIAGDHRSWGARKQGMPKQGVPRGGVSLEEVRPEEVCLWGSCAQRRCVFGGVVPRGGVFGGVCPEEVCLWRKCAQTMCAQRRHAQRLLDAPLVFGLCAYFTLAARPGPARPNRLYTRCKQTRCRMSFKHRAGCVKSQHILHCMSRLRYMLRLQHVCL
jgi:hypothetical protein